jgi:hypothetical protein
MVPKTQPPLSSDIQYNVHIPPLRQFCEEITRNYSYSMLLVLSFGWSKNMQIRLLNCIFFPSLRGGEGVVLPWPALECGDHEESKHGFQHIVVMERVPVPLPLLYDRLVDVRIPVRIKYIR